MDNGYACYPLAIVTLALCAMGSCTKDTSLEVVDGLSENEVHHALEGSFNTVTLDSHYVAQYFEHDDHFKQNATTAGLVIDYSKNVGLLDAGEELHARSSSGTHVLGLCVPVTSPNGYPRGFLFKITTSGRSKFVSLSRLKLYTSLELACDDKRRLYVSLANSVSLRNNSIELPEFILTWIQKQVKTSCVSELEPRNTIVTTYYEAIADDFSEVHLYQTHTYISCGGPSAGGGGGGGVSGDVGGGGVGGGGSDPELDPSDPNFAEPLAPEYVPQAIYNWVIDNCGGTYADIGRLNWLSGKAFEKGVMNGLIFKTELSESQQKFHSPYRASKSTEYSAVSPDGMGPVRVVRTTFPPGSMIPDIEIDTYQNLSWTEVKACQSRMDKSYRDYQLAGMIDALRIKADEDGLPSNRNPTLTVYAATGASLGETLIDYANQRRVNLHLSLMNVSSDGYVSFADRGGSTDFYFSGWAEMECPNRSEEAFRFDEELECE